jgi:uncharacterized protein YihD (DUF1040 family)
MQCHDWNGQNLTTTRIYQKHSNDITWQDSLIECVTLFHKIFQKICKRIYFYNGVINKVEHVIHYELKHHGSICAHVIFWVKKEYVKIITNEIVAFVLVTLKISVNS